MAGTLVGCLLGGEHVRDRSADAADGAPEVESVVARLGGRDWESAAKELVDLGESAVPPLVAALERKERWGRKWTWLFIADPLVRR